MIFSEKKSLRMTHKICYLSALRESNLLSHVAFQGFNYDCPLGDVAEILN